LWIYPKKDYKHTNYKMWLFKCKSNNITNPTKIKKKKKKIKRELLHIHLFCKSTIHKFNGKFAYLFYWDGQKINTKHFSNKKSNKHIYINTILQIQDDIILVLNICYIYIYIYIYISSNRICIPYNYYPHMQIMDNCN